MYSLMLTAGCPIANVSYLHHRLRSLIYIPVHNEHGPRRRCRSPEPGCDASEEMKKRPKYTKMHIFLLGMHFYPPRRKNYARNNVDKRIQRRACRYSVMTIVHTLARISPQRRGRGGPALKIPKSSLCGRQCERH